MPPYIARIFAWARARAAAAAALRAWLGRAALERAATLRPALPWAGVVSGYVGLFALYVGLLLALLHPATSVLVARVLIVLAALGGTTVLAVLLGRLINRGRVPAVGQR